jgi:hypothetical protein
MPDVAWMRLLGPERELGARLQVRTKVFGIPLANDLMSVTVWDPPRRLAIEHVGVVVGYGEWRLEPGGGGTTFTWEERIKMRPKVLGEVALWVYSPWQRWMLELSIRKLKRLVEGGG